METHPKGSRAKVLLTSVFGPYAQDDEFGSRAINPMELYHNQVTRAQGSFSLRMFHRSWGITMIQHNISAPCTVLDFPTLEHFEREVTTEQYDIVGISSIIPNIGKVREMCRIVRQLSPNSKIIVGGHVAAIPGVEKLLDADHIVKGEGISWMRQYLGEDAGAPIQHPADHVGLSTARHGLARAGIEPKTTAATIIPSVGCPMGCNFCTTSAFFGGKGKSVNFYETGDELFDVMQQSADALHTQSFFIMDENFLLNRPRAMQLLARMKQENKPWALYVFSSANAIRKYTMEELVRTRHLLDMDGPGIGNVGLRQTQRHRHPGLDPRAAPARHQDSGIDDCRHGAPHAGEHPRRGRARHRPRRPTSTSSCSTPPSRARRCSSR